MHSVVYAALAHWQTTLQYPDIALAAGISITPEQQELLSPAYESSWW